MFKRFFSIWHAARIKHVYQLSKHPFWKPTAMSANRIQRHLVSSRVSGAMAGCCAAISLTSASVVQASQAWQVRVYEAANLAARKQVASRRRFELSVEKTHLWN